MDIVWGIIIGGGFWWLMLFLDRRRKARLEYEAYAEAERQRCLNSPYYFYITYWVVNGQKPDPQMSERDFNELFEKMSKQIINKV